MTSPDLIFRVHEFGLALLATPDLSSRKRHRRSAAVCHYYSCALSRTPLTRTMCRCADTPMADFGISSPKSAAVIIIFACSTYRHDAITTPPRRAAQNVAAAEHATPRESSLCAPCRGADRPRQRRQLHHQRRTTPRAIDTRRRRLRCHATLLSRYATAHIAGTTSASRAADDMPQSMRARHTPEANLRSFV